MKTYVLIISRTFPESHNRKGDRTKFPDKIACGVFCPGDCSECDFKDPKIHTIRANYKLWKDRAKEINEGKAILSIRYWRDKPYRSKQVELYKLEEIGVQEIFFLNGNIFDPIIDGDDVHDTIEIAKNDGLSLEDFTEWFRKYNLTEPMAIIQFTPFRY